MSRALGRYELLRPLARGGMGEVYLARRRAAGVEKWLVVKRMRPERAGDARFLDLFMREARLSMSLAHQNIVPVFDFGRIDDQVFLAMERVEGKDLGSSLARGTALPAMLAAFVAAECCQALDYAHRRKGPDGAPLGIVHRDVTPRNVLLSWSGEVKLTDFGIAALAGDAARSTIGTPAYMAPEQARNEPTDARADVYAVGLVLREAWTGKRGRTGADREATMAAARTGELEPWPESRAGTDADGTTGARFDGPLRAIIDKATALAPEDRFPDARAMLEALDAFIVDERAARKSDGPARQLATWLADTWQDERDDAAQNDAAIEGDHLVSFLDDGALDVLGTGTQRSMAATAADEVPTVAESPASPASRPPAPAASGSPAQAVRAESPPVVRQEPRPSQPRTDGRMLWLLAIPALAIVTLIVVRVLVHGEHAPPAVDTAVDPNLPTETNQSAVETEQPVETKQPVVETEQPVETKQPVVETKQPVVETKQPVVANPGKPKKSIAAKANGTATTAQGSAALPAPVATHRAFIGSQPWSYFTVDDGATTYESNNAIQLAPGPHAIHYVGQPHFKADRTITIDMPDKDGFTHVEQLKAPTPPASP